MQINSKIVKLNFNFVSTVDMLQYDVTISLKLPVLSWMELNTCSMWVNAGDCTKIKCTWRPETDSPHTHEVSKNYFLLHCSAAARRAERHRHHEAPDEVTTCASLKYISYCWSICRLTTLPW